MIASYLLENAQLLAALPAGAHMVIAGIFGSVIGSFLSVVAHRLPVMLRIEWGETAEADSPVGRYNLWTPRSGCSSCGKSLRPWQNIPVLSYVALKGRCGFCAIRISPKYVFLELAACAIAVVTVWRFGWTLHAFLVFVLAASLLVLAVIDAKEQILPDVVTIPLMWAGLVLNLAGQFVPLADAVVGAIAGYATLWLASMPSRLFAGRDGIGFGDFKFYAALGAWFGWAALPQVFLLSIVTCAAWGALSVVRGRRTRRDAVPLGPFISFAGAITLFCGSHLFDWLWR